MSRKFITGVLAIASLVTVMAAAPVRADNDDLKRFIGTAATLYLLQQALEGNGGRVTYQQPCGHGYGGNHGGQWHGNGHGQKKTLPSTCARTVWGQNNRKRTVMTNACLNKNNVAVKRLPNMCEQRFWLNGKVRGGFGVDCLRGNGWRVAHR